MQLRHLVTVNGELIVDRDDADPDTIVDTAPAGGPVRLDDHVTAETTALLARWSSLAHAVLEERVVGVAVGVRPRLLDPRVDTLDRTGAEVGELAAALFGGPRVAEPTFHAYADLGTSEAELAARDLCSPGVVADLDATAHGVVAAARAWLGDLDRRTVALEGFGEAGEAVARAVEAAGGRLVGISTDRGAVADSRGLSVDQLVDARDRHGAAFVLHLGLDVHRAPEVHTLPVDVLVPGAPIGAIDGGMGARVQAGVVVPVARLPYTAGGLAAMRAAGVSALPDFVTAAGPLAAATTNPALTRSEVLARVERLVGSRVEAARLAKHDPYLHSLALARTFLATWNPAVGEDAASGVLAPEPVGSSR